MPLLTLRDIQLSYGQQPLLDHVNLSIDTGERLCLIGRNGAGKSTLMKVIAEEIQADDGQIEKTQGLSVARLEQEVPDDQEHSVHFMVAEGLGEQGALLSEHAELVHHLGDGDDKVLARFEELSSEIEARGAWQLSQRVDTVLSKLNLDGDMSFAGLSGGMKRRVLLARALVQDPDILLLDEPTNHLDMESIQWLEEFLKNVGTTLVFISHDRAFIRSLATRIIELDRGKLTSWPGSYEKYLSGKQAALDAEERANAEFDKKLSQEEKWIRQGIKARRTRNEGRVRALKAMRDEFSQRRSRTGTASLTIQSSDNSGKIVVEADSISYAVGGKQIVRDFSVALMRGDRVGILGPNGCGKSTLIRLLLDKLTPDSGTVKQGTQLQVAYFDQLRDTLDEEKSVIDNVAEGSDVINLNGQSKHVIGYLQDFLFDPARVRQPVKSLSGGERNRLLLAKLFTKPFNLLVLDEPTNDLDAETLELLEEQLINYQGTLLLVSHDREFIDNVVTSTLVFEHGGLNNYVGGYQDWLRQRPEPKREKAVKAAKQVMADKPAAPRKKRSYKDQRELEELPARIEQLETDLDAVQTRMSDPDFYKGDAAQISAAQTQQSELEQQLAEAFARWDELDQLG
ncbi:heme ABC transporter ATPase [Alcanivorax sp. 97CO-5]|jgi:ATP-binding cassette subfamily F protein uup|uniref:ATP-binding cassette domain-containing protein n=1 Tax=Alcanivorax TaxID=59753 RepID=UPI0003E7DAE9|nr:MULTISPECIES: ATP-binding cassette domain-containing protein [unclassified Alcanivorax]EUC69488.1 heme ABC transporter ATPase [Alcanivorax sp. 97CO-5]PKG01399.1 ABC transporter ATP-binding protein [Alcanivorax sp. 97CO-6]BAP14644.1 ABC transporter ATP-binding protein [Alcanivorax sp. NBRC 101098]